MNDHLEQTIADLQEEVRIKETELMHTKRMVNSLCARAQKPPIYPDSDFQQQQTTGNIRSDQFYGRPLAACVREILEMRRVMNRGASPLEEIMNALKAGGYELDAIVKDEDGQKRGVAISLAKNNQTFHRLPNGNWGLTSWYSGIRERKSTSTETTNGANPSIKRRGRPPKIKPEEEAPKEV